MCFSLSEKVLFWIPLYYLVFPRAALVQVEEQITLGNQ